MAEEEERKRLAEEAEQQRLAEEAERERLEQERREEERRVAEAAEQRRQQEAAAAAATAEQQARRARLLRRKAQFEQEYKQSIRRVVTQKFRPPSGLRPGASCTVRARLVPPNEIVDVQVEQCSGVSGEQRTRLARAVEKAVFNAQPFPLPPHKSVFQRVLIFDFKPNSVNVE